jgi:hypothetical protein
MPCEIRCSLGLGKLEAVGGVRVGLSCGNFALCMDMIVWMEIDWQVGVYVQTLLAQTGHTSS